MNFKPVVHAILEDYALLWAGSIDWGIDFGR